MCLVSVGSMGDSRQRSREGGGEVEDGGQEATRMKRNAQRGI